MSEPIFNVRTTDGIVHVPRRSQPDERYETVAEIVHCGLTTVMNEMITPRRRRGEVRGEYVEKKATCLACLGTTR